MATTGTSAPGRVNNAGSGPVRGTSAPGRATTTTAAGAAPPKANAAPGVNKNITHGLMESLNKKEADEVKAGTWEVANRYSVEFAPAALGDALVTKLGKQDKAKVPMQQSKNPADAVNPESNSVNYNIRTQRYIAGTPILVVIDEILKNSTYIADQADTVIDQVTGEKTAQKPLGNLAWYKISVNATPIEPFDKKRNAYAQDIKYIISAYPINSMQSEFFPEGSVRGRHKSYKYWFTGKNTQVLSFEQSLNSLYSTTFTDQGRQDLATTRKNAQTLVSPPREFQAAVGSSNSQGAEKQANAIGASAADWLYNKSDLAKCSVSIVGDPAWLQEGELAFALSALNYNFNPFNPDGAINFDAQEIIFDLQWNPGVDYDLTGTGLANPNVAEIPQAVWTYKAVQVVSKFSRGKFTQDLTGSWVDVVDPVKPPGKSSAQLEREDAAAVDAAAGVRPLTTQKTFAETLPSSVTNPTPTSSLAKGTQQLLNPPQTTNPTLTQLQSSQAYINARRSGATPAAALDAARQSFSANGTGSIVPTQKIDRET
jgi:hypothetical protein